MYIAQDIQCSNGLLRGVFEWLSDYQLLVNHCVLGALTISVIRVNTFLRTRGGINTPWDSLAGSLVEVTAIQLAPWWNT
jgi:hypothetical protein